MYPECGSTVKQPLLENPNAEPNVLIYSSLPCTGGCPWNHINEENPDGQKTIEEHQKLFKRLLGGLEDLSQELEYLKPIQLFELPTRCEYRSWKSIKRYLEKHGMESTSSMDAV